MYPEPMGRPQLASPPIVQSFLMPSPRPNRQRFISQHIDPQQSRILEIGALDMPTYRGDDTSTVDYLDWFTRDESGERIASNANHDPENLVRPTYVVKDKRFSGQINGRYDLVIANHVIEHVPDPITWLEQLAEIGDTLFLSVPDRRYTFDYLRPVSTVAELVRAHDSDLERPDFLQVLEAIFYYRPLRAADLWEGMPLDKLGQAKFASLGDAIRVARREADKGYADVHCHVFQADTFRSLIDDLAGLIPWGVRAIDLPEHGENEFRVILTH
jgi:Methyltransferase domain